MIPPNDNVTGGIVATDDKMTIDEERKYLRRMKKRYVNAERRGRGKLLDEMEAVTRKHRKYLNRLMTGSLERKKRTKQRGPQYGPEVDEALRVIAESLDYVCAERLAGNLVWMAEHLSKHGELKVSESLLEQLSQISVSTVRRRLKGIRRDKPRLPRRRGRARPNKLTKDIPMVQIDFDEAEPGHFEVDLVHHSGDPPSGEYVCSLQMIDVATGWSERAAVLGRGYMVMEDAFRCILDRLPFTVREIHPDNGGEFFNHHMIRFWGEVVQPDRLSRSRPHHKNDNRFVEQKNSTLIRAYLGNDRLDTVRQTLALNHLYDRMWLYYNFFQPVMRATGKTMIPGDDQRPPRHSYDYDEARTPFDRLCRTDALSPDQRQHLEDLRNKTNPRRLREEIYEWLDYLFSLPGRAPQAKEDVALTLRAPRPRKTKQQGKESHVPVTLSFDRTMTVR
jgi:hypothetical protein